MSKIPDDIDSCLNINQMSLVLFDTDEMSKLIVLFLSSDRK